MANSSSALSVSSLARLLQGSRSCLRTKVLTLASVSMFISCCCGHAFSLLGPFEPWMDVEKGYRLPDDIGGPMNIGEGYRWNIPVITYGFDRSFIDFFGSNGVAAVEEAISMLNELPPASLINLNEYATHAWRGNWRAQTYGLMDLKSQTLALLLEQLGLADAARYVYCLRDFQYYPSQGYTYQVIIRNFDSVTARPSAYLNDALFTFMVPHITPNPIPGQLFCFAQPLPVDSLADYRLVLGNYFPFYSPYGAFVTNLTREDVAGLRYLLSGNQVFCESLPADVHLADTNDGPFIATADRPGVEKLTFVRHPYGPLNGRFLAFTNRWTDVYYDYYLPGYQEVERVTTRPDILFTVADLSPLTPWARTGTTNWINNAGLNGNPGGAGPGVIQPSVTISFNRSGPCYDVFPSPNTNAFPSELNAVLFPSWGSFNGSTNEPVVYPVGTQPFQPTVVHVNLSLETGSRDLHWPLAGQPYQRFSLQTSTNLANWSTVATLTNSGARFDLPISATNQPALFFRTIPFH